MFENAMDIEVPFDAVQVLTAIAVSAVLIIVVAGFCSGAQTVQPSDLNIARFGGI